MKVQESLIYVGNIKRYESIEEYPETYGAEDSMTYRIVDEKMEVNGESELLIKVGEYFIPVRDVKGDFHLWNLLRCFNKDTSLNFSRVSDRNRKMFIPATPEYGTNKFVRGEKALFPNSSDKLTLSELRDLRIRTKYIKQVSKSEIEAVKVNDKNNEQNNVFNSVVINPSEEASEK